MLGRRIPIGPTMMAAVILSLGGWHLMYPSLADPKNMTYVCWKAGLDRMDLDTATSTMIGDADRDKLVIGKTKSQLRERFGYLVTAAEASPYLRGCYQDSSWKDRDVLFIRQSPWMVVFDGAKATDLVLMKGC
jgi:hypothetical protein